MGRKGPQRLKCQMCNGSGLVGADHRDRRGGDKPCPNCGGMGEIGG